MHTQTIRAIFLASAMAFAADFMAASNIPSTPGDGQDHVDHQSPGTRFGMQRTRRILENLDQKDARLASISQQHSLSPLVFVPSKSEFPSSPHLTNSQLNGVNIIDIDGRSAHAQNLDLPRPSTPSTPLSLSFVPPQSSQKHQMGIPSLQKSNSFDSLFTLNSPSRKFPSPQEQHRANIKSPSGITLDVFPHSVAMNTATPISPIQSSPIHPKDSQLKVNIPQISLSAMRMNTPLVADVIDGVSRPETPRFSVQSVPFRLPSPSQQRENTVTSHSQSISSKPVSVIDSTSPDICLAFPIAFLNRSDIIRRFSLGE